MSAWVYMMASRYRGTLYTGITNSLVRRIWEHRNGHGSEFVQQYRCFTLVYAEPHATFLEAIAREKRLKRWNRAWKFDLIERANRDWLDLSDQLIG